MTYVSRVPVILPSSPSIIDTRQRASMTDACSETMVRKEALIRVEIPGRV